MLGRAFPQHSNQFVAARILPLTLYLYCEYTMVHLRWQYSYACIALAELQRFLSHRRSPEGNWRREYPMAMRTGAP